jgi:hypothetical protein
VKILLILIPLGIATILGYLFNNVWSVSIILKGLCMLADVLLALAIVIILYLDTEKRLMKTLKEC